MKRIKGGRKAFIKALDEGFEANCHNPTLYYSKDNGFYIKSGLIPNSDHKVSLIFYEGNSGKRCLESRDYDDVRQDILDTICKFTGVTNEND